MADDNLVDEYITNLVIPTNFKIGSSLNKTNCTSRKSIDALIEYVLRKNGKISILTKTYNIVNQYKCFIYTIDYTENIVKEFNSTSEIKLDVNDTLGNIVVKCKTVKSKPIFNNNSNITFTDTDFNIYIELDNYYYFYLINKDKKNNVSRNIYKKVDNNYITVIRNENEINNPLQPQPTGGKKPTSNNKRFTVKYKRSNK
jgi:hypothetical protein